jgi:hypothetical protein
MTESVFITILLVHFLADFGLQTHEQSQKKSSSNKWLFYHVGVYSLVWLPGSYLLFGDWSLALNFVLVTFVYHFLTDWLTSRIGKPFWAKEDFHNGFVVIGADQVLHYLQLYYTYKMINEFKMIIEYSTI